jgi:hypothetical protein
MSPLLEKVLEEVDLLDVNEQFKLISHLLQSLQQKSNLSPKENFSRKDLFGCMRGQIKISEDFNTPLADFAEYMS